MPYKESPPVSVILLPPTPHNVLFGEYLAAKIQIYFDPGGPASTAFSKFRIEYWYKTDYAGTVKRTGWYEIKGSLPGGSFSTTTTPSPTPTAIQTIRLGSVPAIAPYPTRPTEVNYSIKETKTGTSTKWEISAWVSSSYGTSASAKGVCEVKRVAAP